jgi:uncharacterized protein
VKFSAPVKVAFSYDLYEDDSLEIRGTVAYRLEGQCSRCLQPASQEVTGELDAYFQPRKDAEDYAYTGSTVDITRAVDDAIMASMPFTLSCGDACEGLSYTDKTDN